MPDITIPSVLNGQTRAYRVSSEWPWDRRGAAPLSLHLQQFETYGDGLTQHSGGWCVQFSEITDACLSLTRAILANPMHEAWSQLAYMICDVAPAELAFALTVRHREKAQWFSWTERKLSTSESKRNDRRWDKVESWMDGQPASALSLLLNRQNGIDWFKKLAMADDLRTLAGYPCWEDYFKPVEGLAGDWHQAFRAFRHACQAVALLDGARRAADCAENNSKPREEAAA